HFVIEYVSPLTAGKAGATSPNIAVRDRLTEARPLDEVEAKSLLREYGIPVVKEIVATSPSEATDAIKALSGRGVLKILSPDIAHKSDAGLVRIGVATDDAADEYRRLIDAAAQWPGADVRGVVVQALVEDVVAEAILGVSHQAPFGPTILIGLGGGVVEWFESVAF